MSEASAVTTAARERPLGRAVGGVERFIAGIRPAVWVTAVVLLTLPAWANGFFQYQVFGWAFVWGTIALGLMFLAGYGGMVSLAQMTTAAVSAYMVAILGDSAVTSISFGWPAWAYIPLAVVIATAFGTLVGVIAIRTEGIYTIMITLAIAAAFYSFANQNQAVFYGQRGFNGVLPPHILGIDWHQSTPFYYLTLGVAAISLGLTHVISRSSFCLALEGVRDNPRRMASLGFNVAALRVLAYAYASLLAAVAGVLVVWFNGQISPGTAGVGAAIDILVIAVVGGTGHPIGPFIGALIYILLKTFAIDVFQILGFASLRFNLLVGLGFLAIVAFSPDGAVGLWRRWGRRVLTGNRKP